jgi:branched-subunit amino acid ABC-type transport system permease component
VKALSGDLLLGDLMLLLALLIVGGIAFAAVRPLHSTLKKKLTGSISEWGPLVISTLIVIVAAYLLALPLQNVLNAIINSVSPLSETMAAEMEISNRTEYPLLVSRIQFVVVTSSVLLMFGLYNLVQHTKLGKAMRAVAEDKDVAALMGIDVDRIITSTFALGAALAGAAGVLYALIFRQVNFFMGFFPGLKAFTAAVLGGIGNVPGAMIGGLFLGVFESLGPSLFLEGLGITAPYQLKDVIAFTMLVLVLIFRPTGIMGVELSKKKA